MTRRTGITRSLTNIVDDIKDLLDDALDSVGDLEHDTRDSLSRTLCPERGRRSQRRHGPDPDDAVGQVELTALWTRLGQIEELLRQQQTAAAPDSAKAAGASGRAPKTSS
ncbi:hypothetical protein [Streptomyces sp. MST-110588]|uniref:hypothetical protein n=1 Tax=Streptomyces sp. MST-110588 TaxID=2833628 RepID=UPI001F5DEFC4|nr:hypothetical protein [Streptomyces sp. MST-110588]UNO38927.1 hypothetical protein KGS77_03820 [Streptomyces sp. MST-110588]